MGLGCALLTAETWPAAQVFPVPHCAEETTLLHLKNETDAAMRSFMQPSAC